MSGRTYIPLRIPAILLHVSDERCADTAAELLERRHPGRRGGEPAGAGELTGRSAIAEEGPQPRQLGLSGCGAGFRSLSTLVLRFAIRRHQASVRVEKADPGGRPFSRRPV